MLRQSCTFLKLFKRTATLTDTVAAKSNHNDKNIQLVLLSTGESLCNSSFTIMFRSAAVKISVAAKLMVYSAPPAPDNNDNQNDNKVSVKISR